MASTRTKAELHDELDKLEFKDSGRKSPSGKFAEWIDPKGDPFSVPDMWDILPEEVFKSCLEVAKRLYDRECAHQKRYDICEKQTHAANEDKAEDKVIALSSTGTEKKK